MATLLFSGLSAVITGVLSYLAWRQIKVGEVAARAAEASAKAATDTAKLLIAQEAPYLYFSFPDEELAVSGPTDFDPVPRLKTKVTGRVENLGRTVAVFYFERFESWIQQTDGSRTRTDIVSGRPAQRAIRATGGTAISAQVLGDCSDEDYAAIFGARMAANLRITLFYRDVHEGHWQTEIDATLDVIALKWIIKRQSSTSIMEADE